jgi:hypothetical protein
MPRALLQSWLQNCLFILRMAVYKLVLLAPFVFSQHQLQMTRFWLRTRCDNSEPMILLCTLANQKGCTVNALEYALVRANLLWKLFCIWCTPIQEAAAPCCQVSKLSLLWTWPRADGHGQHHILSRSWLPCLSIRITSIFSAFEGWSLRAKYFAHLKVRFSHDMHTFLEWKVERHVIIVNHIWK